MDRSKFYHVLSTFSGLGNRIQNRYKVWPLQRLPERVASWFFTHRNAASALFPMHIVSYRNSQYCVTKWQKTFGSQKTPNPNTPSKKCMFYYVLSTFLGQGNNIKNHYRDSPLQRLPERVASWFFTHMKEESVLFPIHVVSSRNSQYCTAKWNIGREPC